MEPPVFRAFEDDVAVDAVVSLAVVLLMLLVK